MIYQHLDHSCTGNLVSDIHEELDRCCARRRDYREEVQLYLLRQPTKALSDIDDALVDDVASLDHLKLDSGKRSLQGVAEWLQIHSCELGFQGDQIAPELAHSLSATIDTVAQSVEVGQCE